MGNSEGKCMVSGVGGVIGWALVTYIWSLLGIIHGPNKLSVDRNLVGIAPGDADVAPMCSSIGRSYGVRVQEDLGMIYGNICGRRIGGSERQEYLVL